MLWNVTSVGKTYDIWWEEHIVQLIFIMVKMQCILFHFGQQKKKLEKRSVSLQLKNKKPMDQWETAPLESSSAL